LNDALFSFPSASGTFFCQRLRADHQPPEKIRLSCKDQACKDERCIPFFKLVQHGEDLAMINREDSPKHFSIAVSDPEWMGRC
jgi:hypothetical protein